MNLILQVYICDKWNTAAGHHWSISNDLDAAKKLCDFEFKRAVGALTYRVWDVLENKVYYERLKEETK